MDETETKWVKLGKPKEFAWIGPGPCPACGASFAHITFPVFNKRELWGFGCKSEKPFPAEGKSNQGESNE